MFIKPAKLTLIAASLMSIFGMTFAGSLSSPSYALSPAEFIPVSSPCAYTNLGSALANTGCSQFQAGFHLPDGMTINHVTIHYMDGSASNMTVAIVRNDYTYTPTIIFTWTSSVMLGTPQTATLDVAIPIDNSTHSYFVLVDLPATNLILLGVTLESSYSSILVPIFK